VAKVTMKYPDDLIGKIAKLEGKTDEICEKALTAGAAIVERQVRSNLKDVVGKHTKEASRSTGQLVEALGTTQVRVDNKGDYNIKVGFDEPRSDGDSNAKIANVLEYGRAGQPPKPFLAPAKKKTKKPAEAKMKHVLEEEINKL